MESILQILLVLGLVALNAYFVAAEFALVSVRKTRVDELARKGSKRAKVLQKALRHLDDYISATQVGITLASLALGWVGEPAIAHFFSIASPTIAFIIAFSIITFLHIVLGELVPKSIAIQRSEKTALLVIAPLVLFSKIFRPFIWFLNRSGHLFLSLFGMSAPSGHQLVHSEEEIRMLLSQSALEGVIPTREVEMVNKVFLLGDTPVKLVMVPRKEMLAFNKSTPAQSVIKEIEENLHSRFPVYKDSIDSIIGFIHVKDLYRELLAHKENVPLSRLRIVRPIINLAETRKIDTVLHEMRKKRIHIAVVKNENGRVIGVVTLEDIVESLVGEIEDEFETVI